MKNIFNFLGAFDWIRPTGVLLEEIFRGSLFSTDVWTFFVPFSEAMAQGWTPPQIRGLLMQNGVESWGDLITGGELSFNVKLGQAQFAEYILLRNGIPVAPKSLSVPSKCPEERSVYSYGSYLNNLIKEIFD